MQTQLSNLTLLFYTVAERILRMQYEKYRTLVNQSEQRYFYVPAIALDDNPVYY